MKYVKVILWILIVIFVLSCLDECSCKNRNTESESIYDSTSESYPNDTYCADVNYYNPDTGYQDTYKLNVDVLDGMVVKIWFSKGWLDSDQFTPVSLDVNGNCSITTFDGKQFNVTIAGAKCDFIDEDISYKRSESNYVSESDYVGDTKCPDCGNEKNKEDLFCANCTEKAKCPLCGDLKLPTTEVCISCKEANNIVYKCNVCGKEDEMLYNSYSSCHDCYFKQ